MAGYVADAVEQFLLLLKDMADLRSIRQHKVFLGLKRDLAMVSPFFFVYLFIYYYYYYLTVHLFPSKTFKLPLGSKRW